MHLNGSERWCLYRIGKLDKGMTRQHFHTFHRRVAWSTIRFKAYGLDLFCPFHSCDDDTKTILSLCFPCYVWRSDLLFHFLDFHDIILISHATRMIYPVGVSQMALGKSINCRDDKSYLRASSPLRFFYSFFMLHNPCVSPCTQYCRSIHFLRSKPSIHQIFIPKNSTLSTYTTWFGEININRRSLNYLHRDRSTLRTLTFC